MHKSRLGVSVGLLGAGVFLSGIIGIIPVVLLAGYILLFESNEWLRKTAVKAAVLFFVFCALQALIDLPLQLLNATGNTMVVFGVAFYWPGVQAFMMLLTDLLTLLKTAALLYGGWAALRQRSLPCKPIDKLMEKHM